jgi:hypothetical protein
MSSILRALEKAKKEREELERRRTAGEPAPSPTSPSAQPQMPGETSRGEAALPSAVSPENFDPASHALLPKSLPAQQSPYASTGHYDHASSQHAASSRPPATGGRDIRLFVGGLLLGLVLIALISVGAAALTFAMMQRSASPDAAPTPTPEAAAATATPSPAPTTTPQPGPTPDPDAPPATMRVGAGGGLVIEDIRYADSPTSPTLQQPRITITPPPAPFQPEAPRGDAPVLLSEPTPTPAPPPTPAPTLAPATTLLAEDFEPFKIDAILYSAARPVVMIRGRERYVGDVVDGYRIEKIVSDGVEFSHQGRTVRVRF